jgi:glycosyltransferase involved in cell wall biosynthesis
MKILYFLNLDQYSTNLGIIQKSFLKKAQWKKNGHKVELVFIYSEEKERSLIVKYGDCNFIKRQPQRLAGQFRAMRSLGLWPDHETALFELIDNFSPDIVYHRTFEISNFIRRICKNHATILELNGNEIGNLFANGNGALRFFPNWIRAAKIKLGLKTFLQLHKGIVVVTYELLELYKKQSGNNTINQKSIVIPNGIDIRSYKVRKKAQAAGDIKLVFIGTPGAAWHGIEVIMAIAKRTIGILEFHLIGERFDESSDIPPNVKVYGYLSEADYRQVISGCDIGIGTLALNNAGLSEASPLKVREYVAAGLPIIIGYRDTAFERQPIPQWVLQLPNKPDAIMGSVEKIVSFCRDYRDFVVPTSEAELYFSSEHLEKDRLSFFERIVSSSVPVHDSSKSLDDGL